MTGIVVFQTQGLIDLRAFTVMGFNAKPTKEVSIGFFGTGLKYAVAVICRLGWQSLDTLGRSSRDYILTDYYPTNRMDISS